MHVCPAYNVTAFQRSVQAEAMARANGLLSIRSAEIGAIPDLSGRLKAFEASLIVVGAVAMFRGSASVQRAGIIPVPQFLTRTAMQRTVRTVGASEPPMNRSRRHAASLMRLFSCPDSVRCMPAMAGGARAKARKGTNKAAQTPASGQVRLGSEPPAASGSVRSLVGGVHRQPERLPMTDSVIPGAHALAITDITAIVDPAEPRILDVRLAEALGFADPRMIRKLIARHIDTLRAFGRCDTVEHRPARGGRAEQRYYLNRKQAVYIAAKSETDRAVEITIQVVEIFDAVTSNRSLRATDAAGQVLSLTEQEIMVALAFRRQVQEAVAVQVERALAERRFELGATASIAVTQILTGALTYDIDTKRFTQRDDALPGGSS